MNGSKLCGMILFAVLAAGCEKKHPLPPPPPLGATTTRGTASGKPGATFTAEPSTVNRGESALLRWEVTGSNYISIDTFGAVQPNGERRVTPYATTTYHLTADGPGGRFTAEATVTVNPGDPTVPPPSSGADANANSHLTFEQRLAQQVQDVFFAYGEYNIPDESRATLTRDADALKAIFRDFPSASLLVEGHCDERGSAEFNLGLGDRRATSTKEFLVQLGVPAEKLRTVSYGKERPQCTEQTEDCYARNRRAHITAAQ